MTTTPRISKIALCFITVLPFMGSEALARMEAPTTPLAASSSGGFDGFYMGLNAGLIYHFVRNSYVSSIGTPISFENKTKKYGFIGGTYLGYIIEIGASRVMVGLETNILTTATNFKYDFGPNSTDVYGQGQFFRKASAAITPLVGKMFNARTLLFLKAGVESTRYNAKLIYNTDPVTPAIVSGKTIVTKPKLTRFIIGAGFDYLATPRISVGLEYNYTGLFKKFRNFPVLLTQSIALKTYEHKILIRAAFRVG